MAGKKNGAVLCGCRGDNEKDRCDVEIHGMVCFWTEDGKKLPIVSSGHYHNHLKMLKEKREVTQEER